MQRMMQDMRLLVAVTGGGLVTLSLFFLMHQLIASHQSGARVSVNPLKIDMVRVQKQPAAIHASPRLKPKPKFHKQPPTSTPTTAVTPRLLPTGLKLPEGPGDNPLFGTPNTGINSAGSGYSPLHVRYRTPPLYPPQAAYQGGEGNVRTCFTVAADGSVFNPYVAGASPPEARRLFAAAALNSILQWKFYPRMVNGQAVATPNVCQVIRFQLNDR